MLEDLSWNLFSRTGSPEAYLLYKEVKKDIKDMKEAIDAKDGGRKIYGLPENNGNSATGNACERKR